MEIKYEIRTLNNAEGKGIMRKFIRLQQETPMTDDELASAVEHECTLSRADIKAVFEALRYHIAHSLSSGRRFHIPKLGYFSLTASLADPEQQRKITGRDIFLRGIHFQPEDAPMDDLRQDVSFTQARYIMQSIAYQSDELWDKVSDYLSTHHYLTCRIMRTEFGLSARKARQWLAHFVQQGRLKKEGTPHLPLYFLAA